MEKIDKVWRRKIREKGSLGEGEREKIRNK